jgi:hypothetical protein
MQDNYFCLKFLADCFRLVYTHHRIWWIHWSWWQLVISIHDKADGLILCEQCLKGCDHAHSWCVNFAGCGRMVTFKVSLWIFCCNLIDVLVICLWGPQCKSNCRCTLPIQADIGLQLLMKTGKVKEWSLKTLTRYCVVHLGVTGCCFLNLSTFHTHHFSTV